jgi:DNA repair exonuclease SbcCD ATPase subunit
MVEFPRDPTTKELLHEIRQLQANVETLTKHLEKVARQQKDWDEINTEYRKLIERDATDALDRIKRIELKLFPNLADDLSKAQNIIGEGDGHDWNPLDHRKP